MPFDLVVRGGLLVTPAGVLRSDLTIDGGRVVELGPDLPAGATEELDAAGLHIFPGLVDTHVHFNEPGRESWEGIASGSAALAAGGGTLFADMPLNSTPPVLYRESFLAKQAAAEAASITDFALWGGLTPDSLEHMPDLAELGVLGFKAFMSDSGIADFRAADDLTLYEGMRRAAALGLPVAVHAESEALTRALTARARTLGGASVRDYLESRPVLAELEAIQRAILFAGETGAELHIVHVSTARGVRLVAEARAKGVRVTCETCPHYLHFNEADLERLGAPLKCAPPLRAEAERLALWQALLQGELDFIASDHSPSPPELKEAQDFFDVWGGISGVQATLAVLLTRGAEQGLPPERVAALTAANPAARFGLPGKGRLEPGFDADFALVDLGDSYLLEPQALLTRHKLSPYLGQRFRGRVRQTFLRGRAVYRDGKILPHACGRLVRSSPNS